MPKLLLKFNAAVIKEIPFDKDALMVGRKPDNDIVIDNPAVSGHHCKLIRQGATHYVEDLESTNGTYVNQKRIKKSGLHHNDVISLAKHSLVFLEDVPPEDSKAPVSDGSETFVLPPEKQAQLLAAAAPGDGDKAVGCLRVLKGLAGQPEYELRGFSTYIGKSDRVQIPILGTGLFKSAPEVAALVCRKPEGYVLRAVVDGYPLVNGRKISGETILKDGDLIDCGGTTMQFVLKEPNPAA